MYSEPQLKANDGGMYQFKDTGGIRGIINDYIGLSCNNDTPWLL